MKLLGVSSPKSSTVSLDLLNLYVVNQISDKKDSPKNMRKPVHIDITENPPLRRHNIELPMSPPRTQHKSDLDHIQNRLQKKVLDSRRQHLADRVKYQHHLSQTTELTYADSGMEHEDNIARTFSSCPLSPSSYWSSNCTHLAEENFNTNLMDNTWEEAYEEKLQNQPGNSCDQDPWIIKPPGQCIFRTSDAVPQELFKVLHRLKYTNSSMKNPVTMTNSGSEIFKGIENPLFDVVKETAEWKTPRDGSDCAFLALFEDGSKPIHKNPSTKLFNHPVNQSNTDPFFIDSDNRHQLAIRNYPYDTREAYPAVDAKNHAADRHLEGMFTAPEQVSFKSNNVSSASYKNMSGCHKSHLQDCHEGQHYFKPSAHLENVEAFAYRHDPQIDIKENVQHSSRNKRNKSTGDEITYQRTVFAPLSDYEPVKESAWRPNQLFGSEEFTTAQERESEFGVSSNLHETEKDVETSVSSQSLCYSPRQTESCFSSSPDTFEEEDTTQKKNYLNEQPLKMHNANVVLAPASREPPETSDTKTLPLQPSSILTSKEAHHIQEKACILCTTEQDNQSHTAPSEGRSFHQSARCDAWSQTESSVTEVRRVDVATQCGTTWACSCGSSLLAARSPGELPPPSTRGTTEGHRMPAREQPEPAGSAAAAASFSCEAEYLSLAGRRTLEVLNYIDAIKEGEKQ